MSTEDKMAIRMGAWLGLWAAMGVEVSRWLS